MSGVSGVRVNERLCEWLRANGIDPGDVPYSAQVDVGDGHITLPIVQRYPDGSVKWSAAAGLVTVSQTFPIVVPLPPDAAEWFRPRCPMCGR